MPLPPPTQARNPGLPRLLPHAAWVFVAVVFAPPALALTPRDELLRLVPDDAAFCLTVQDLRGHLDEFLASPFVKQWQASRVGQAVAGAPETRKMLETGTYFRERLGIDWDGLRNDILGDAVVLAYWPGPAGQEDQEQGLALVRAGNAAALAALMERLNKESGKAVLTRQHRGVNYVAWGEGKGAVYYFLHGPVLAASQKEETLRRVIDQDRTAGQDAEPPLTARLRQLGLDKALAALWINPRAFEPEMRRKAAQGQVPEALVLNNLLTYWQALDGIALFARLGKTDLETGLAVRFEPERLPAAARRLTVKEVKPSDLWRYFPDDALVAVGGRLDAVALTELVSGFLPEEARQAARDAVNRGAGAVLDRDVLHDVLPCVGPDWGFCIIAPPRDEKAWVPRLVAALRLQSGDKGLPLDRAAFEALNTLSVLAVLSYNSNHADRVSLKTVFQDKVEVRYLTNHRLSQLGVQPAYALKDGYLVAASSPEAVQSFRAKEAAAPPGPPGEIPLVRVAFGGVRRYFKERADALAGFFAENDSIPKEEAGRRVGAATSALELVDRLEISQRSTPNQVTLIVRLRPAQPLGK